MFRELMIEAVRGPGRQQKETFLVEKRITTELSTCGYLNGDPKLIRTANSGYDCRVDTVHALWGFCPTTVIAATDCGLAAACIDSFACSNGCGKTTDLKATTWTCGQGDQPPFCSTALLTFGVDQTYSYLGCGTTAKTDHYLVTPTSVSEAAPTVVSVSAVTITRSEVPLPTSTTQTSPSPSSTATSSSNTPNPSLSTFENTSIRSGITTAISAAPITAAPTSEPQPSNATNNNLGPILGGVLGGLALICATILLAIYLMKRGRLRKTSSAPRVDGDLGPQPASEMKNSNGGWGPTELPGGYSDPTGPSRSPRELPAYSAHPGRSHGSPVELA